MTTRGRNQFNNCELISSPQRPAPKNLKMNLLSYKADDQA